MKHLTLIIITLFVFQMNHAQNNNYSKLWKQVETFENEGLPKSALKIVEDLETLAKKENQDKQLIKTLLFKSKYALILEEDAQLQVVLDFKKAISNSPSPEKNVLQNMLATLYWQYFQHNRWKFYNRTKTSEKVDDKDFRTWDLETLFEEIHNHYQASLKNGLILQQTPIRDFDILLQTQKNSETFRPSVFDLLAHNALSFYKTNENRITKPAETFSIQDEKFISPARKFSSLELKSSDSLALQYHALRIYQDLIQFHLKEDSSLALAQVNIERLEFVKQNTNITNAQDVLLSTYIAERGFVKNKEAEALYTYEIASIYYQQGSEFSQENKENQWKIKEALELCTQTTTQFPNSLGAEKCKTLSLQITKPQLQITTESFLRPNQTEKLLVSHKNTDVVDFKAYQLSKKQYDAFQKIYREDAKKTFIEQLKVNSSWTAKLTNEKDYQNHSTEVLLPKFSNGLYLVVANTKEIWASATLQVSRIAMVESEDNDEKHLQFIDRAFGAPIVNAEVAITFSYQNKVIQTQKLKTDQHGRISFKKAAHNRSTFEVEVNHNKETTYFGNSHIYYYDRNNTNNKTVYQSFIFTDRSIYRPGQTVFYKAIALKTKDLKSEVIPEELLVVTLYNANDEEVSVQKLKTNAYGSISGEFILPDTGLNGEYYLEIESETNLDLDNEHYFSVEEYKRPKFEATFKPITDTYKVNDSVTVNGLANAFSGSSISNAKVVYRVKREVNYPSWYRWSRPYYNSQAQEITFGETLTNSKGEFELTFKAIPDDTVNKDNLPVFSYKITADVTDLNGETRSATTTVNVGYHTILAKIIASNLVDKTNKEHTFGIETKNLNGEFVPASGTVNIYKLKAPDFVLRPRPWQAPDYKTLSKTEFKTLFPHEAYDNENESQNWLKGELVLQTTFNTENEKTIALGNIKKWDSGKYVAVLKSEDKFGQALKDEALFTVFSDKDEALADNELFQIKTDKSTYNIGDIAEITLATAAEELVVTVTTEKNKNVVETQTITLKENSKTLKFPIAKNDLGGFVIHYSYAFTNSFNSGQVLVNIPYPTSKLHIETLSFRDKLQPGTDETWSFKITGDNKEKASAELLASMYDASLDQFKTHSWNFSPYQPNAYRSYMNTSSHLSFGVNNFRIHQDYQNYYSNITQQFDQLNWFGLSLNENFVYKTQKAMVYNEMVESELNEEVEVGYGTYLRDNFDRPDNRNFNDEDDYSGKQAKITTSNNLDDPEYYFYVRKGKFIKKKDQVVENDFSQIKVRKNLQETAFFFPKLTTNEAGEISFNFTTPEALTKWNLNLLAHNKKGEFDQKTLTTVTQKELMVIPNAPRFLREGDKIVLSAKISNLTNTTIGGQAQLVLTNPITGEGLSNAIITEPFEYQTKGQKYNPKLIFSAKAKENTEVSWILSIPEGIGAIQYKILASAGSFSDGEQNVLPVLSNRMLVTETLPMYVKTGETKTFVLDKLKTNNSKTLKHHKLTLEITSNPAWYAVF